MRGIMYKTVRILHERLRIAGRMRGWSKNFILLPHSPFEQKGGVSEVRKTYFRSFPVDEEHRRVAWAADTFCLIPFFPYMLLFIIAEMCQSVEGSVDFYPRILFYFILFWNKELSFAFRELDPCFPITSSCKIERS